MCHSKITQLAAKKVMLRLDSSSTPVALFANGFGSWHVVKANTKTFEIYLSRHPDHFRGVFDFNISMSDLQDELAAAGVK